MLDSQERLTIQVQPDKTYAKDILNSSFGKTESWYVLNTREIDGEHTIGSNGSFYVVVYSGEGTMVCNDEEYMYSQGDEIFISAAIKSITFKSTESSKLLLCYPAS